MQTCAIMWSGVWIGLGQGLYRFGTFRICKDNHADVGGVMLEGLTMTGDNP